MCDHQRQTSTHGAMLPCPHPDCWPKSMGQGFHEWNADVDYTRECFLPAPDGTPAFWFWLRRDA